MGAAVRNEGGTIPSLYVFGRSGSFRFAYTDTNDAAHDDAGDDEPDERTEGGCPSRTICSLVAHCKLLVLGRLVVVVVDIRTEASPPPIHQPAARPRAARGSFSCGSSPLAVLVSSPPLPCTLIAAAPIAILCRTRQAQQHAGRLLRDKVRGHTGRDLHPARHGRSGGVSLPMMRSAASGLS